MNFLEILGLGSKIIDKVMPDAESRLAAKQKLLELQQNGEFKEDEMRYSAINAEAASQDKWTSRARPAFLYVVYLLILSSIPFCVVYAYNPATGDQLVIGFNKWLNAIPEDLYWLMGAGYLGYSASRSVDKAMTKKK